MAWFKVTERNGEALNARDGTRTGEREHVDRPRKNENMAYILVLNIASTI